MIKFLPVQEAAKRLWYQPETLMRLLEKYPRHIEHYCQCGGTSNAKTFEEARKDPECVIIPEPEVTRIMQNKERFERCKGCGNLYRIGDLNRIRGGFHEDYACETCLDDADTCEICDEPILDGEGEDGMHDWCKK